MYVHDYHQIMLEIIKLLHQYLHLFLQIFDILPMFHYFRIHFTELDFDIIQDILSKKVAMYSYAYYVHKLCEMGAGYAVGWSRCGGRWHEDTTYSYVTVEQL